MSLPMFPTRGLYTILDLASLEQRKIDPIRFAQAVLAGAPTVLQLRAKNHGARDVLILLRRLVPMCRRAGVLCFANDRPDLATLAGCDGFHVGQEDLPLAEARRLAPGLLSGVSTHSREQLEQALLSSPSYVAVGPVFSTTTKKNPDPVVGLELLRLAVARSSCPVVGIGGITRERAPEIARLGALGAVIRALLPDQKDMTQVTEQTLILGRMLRGGSL